MTQQSAIYRFGSYEFHSRTRELFKLGVRLKLRPQPMQVLNLLLDRAGDVVSRDELRHLLWSHETFVDFEHGLNNSIKELRAVLSDSAGEPRYIQTLPKLGYRLVVPVNVERVSGSGELAVPLETSQKPHPAENLSVGHGVRPATHIWERPAAVWIALALLVVATGVLIWPRLHARSSAKNERMMIAVLPFENLTGDVTQDYFSDGLTEEMIAQLGRLNPQHIGVIARTSVMRYKNTKEPLDQIGRELGIQYVLEGTVRRDAGRVRISAQLIQLKDQSHVWAREYDRDLNSVLALQGEIAEETTGEIEQTLNHARLSPPAVSPARFPANPKAYDLYLRGRYFWNQRTVDGLQQAIQLFQGAISEDPNYAAAYAGLADSYSLLGGYRVALQGDFMPEARTAAVHALQLDEHLASAHTSLALVSGSYYWDWQTAEKEFRRAIELDPNYATAHQWFAEHLAWRGRFEEAFSEMARARQLDPMSLVVAADEAKILYYSRQYERAIREYRAVLEMQPDFPAAHMIAFAYFQQGNLSDPARDLESWSRPEDVSWNLMIGAYVSQHSGRAPEARHDLQQLLAMNTRQPMDPSPIIHTYIALGKNDEALAWLEKGYDEHSTALRDLKVDPFYDPLRGDPRFQKVLQRIGLGL